MNYEKLKEVLEKHRKYLTGNLGGESADLNKANLISAFMSGANLDGVNLSGANLSRANLKGVNLYGATLTGATGIIRIETSPFTIIATSKGIQIGCEYKTAKEWSKVTKKQAIEMGLPKEKWTFYKAQVKLISKELK